jgi:hypothetical protein
MVCHLIPDFMNPREGAFLTTKLWTGVKRFYGPNMDYFAFCAVNAIMLGILYGIDHRDLNACLICRLNTRASKAHDTRESLII